LAAAAAERARWSAAAVCKTAAERARCTVYHAGLRAARRAQDPLFGLTGELREKVAAWWALTDAERLRRYERAEVRGRAEKTDSRFDSLFKHYQAWAKRTGVPEFPITAAAVEEFFDFRIAENPEVHGTAGAIESMLKCLVAKTDVRACCRDLLRCDSCDACWV
jgi:hypothetical protein